MASPPLQCSQGAEAHSQGNARPVSTDPPLQHGYSDKDRSTITGFKRSGSGTFEENRLLKKQKLESESLFLY